jgi:hypothetical protein
MVEANNYSARGTIAVLTRTQQIRQTCLLVGITVIPDPLLAARV